MYLYIINIILLVFKSIININYVINIYINKYNAIQFYMKFSI